MINLFRSLTGSLKKKTMNAADDETRPSVTTSEDVSGDLEDPELSGVSFTPETGAEEYFIQNRKQPANGAFIAVHDAIPPADEPDWDLPVEPALPEPAIASAPKPARKPVSRKLRATIASTCNGPLPSMAVRSDDAAELKARIGGEAATLGLQDTLEAAALASRLGLPIVVTGKGLLKEFSSLKADEYVISTLGSRSAAGNFVHAMVISPVLSIEEIMSSDVGRAWLAGIVRKEQLLVSYRPIRGAASCEDLAERARTMPTDAITIISKQRGLDTTQRE